MSVNRSTRRGSQQQLGRSKQLRRNLTGPERGLWYLLRGRQLAGMKFRRQQIIGPYIVDFYCAQTRLVLEVDGESHVGRGASDAARDAYLRSHGLRVLRVTNDDVLRDPEAVMLAILKLAESEA